MEIGIEVLKAINGDANAMEVLYNETYPKLRAVTISILKNEDDAEDIIQESYIKAFSSLNQLEDPDKFEGWLCRIASNKCKDYLKKHKPVLFSDLNKGDEEDEDPYEWSIEDKSVDYNPEAVAISDDTRRQLMELVNSLPDEQRICLVYYAVEEMKISEIADLLEVPEATVKSRLKYAKDKMRNKIETLEKQGVKIRSVSGFALIPFLHYLFATEAKAVALGSFGIISEAVATAAKANSAAAAAANTVAKTVVTEAAKQAGAKNAVGIGDKIAALPLATKIAAGVIMGVLVASTVAVYNATDMGENNDIIDKPNNEVVLTISNEDEEPQLQEEEDIYSELSKIPHEEIKSNVHFIPMEESCCFDLDGDGTDEDIYVTAEKDYNHWTDNYYYWGQVDIVVNGVIYNNICEADYLSDYYCIIDIDKSDSKLHLAIQDYGPSDDYFTTIFEYDKTLENIGMISGVFDFDVGFYDTICYGNGVIGTYGRLDVLQTWFGKILYKLEGSKIHIVEQPYYEATKPSTHTLLTDLIVYEIPNLSSKKTIIPKDSKISILGTDNNEWLKIEIVNSTSYWIKLYDGWNVLVDDNTLLGGEQVFDWLNYAD